MIPRRIKLVNFLSYRECELDLTGVRLAVLSGRNGDGKSALLDAMTWALWGKGRGRSDDQRVRLGADHALVDFEFEASGAVHRVVRKRTRGKALALDLFQLTEMGWRSANGGTLSETQAEIIRRVRMDYETFENSAFIAQNRADEFTKRTPAERKAVFRKILGLELYETLSKLATDRRKEVEFASKAMRASIEEAEEQLARLPGVTAEIDATRGEIDEVTRTIAEREADEAALRGLVAVREQLEQRLAERRSGLRETRAAIERARSTAAAARAEVDRCRALLAREPELLAARDELGRLREEEARLAAALEEARRLDQQIERARGAIAAEQARMEANAAAARRELERQRNAAADLDDLRARLAALEGEVAAIAALREQARAADAEAADHRSRAAVAEAAAKRCKEQNRELHLKREELLNAQRDGGAIQCPVCLQPLDPEDLDHVLAEYAAQKRELGQRFDEATAAAREAAAAAAAADAESKRLVAEADRRDRALARDRQETAARLGAAEEAARLLPELEGALAAVEQVLARQEFAAAEREALARAERELHALAYDEERHRVVRGRIAELAEVEPALQALAAAHERVDILQRRLEELEGEMSTLAQQEAAILLALAEEEQQWEATEDVGPRLREVAAAVAAARDYLSQLQQRLGRLDHEEQTLRALAARIEEEKSRAAACIEEAALFGELAQALGRDGVQAMLIQQALPRLEYIANGMLERMTGGRITVQLSTTKTNRAGQLQDTLDIRIQDDAGVRDYEMYSGGEAFRVDFALRIALARLLAERAGAELPTLIIDEGFGSQDAEGIDRLVEAITSISEDFRLILVVTHVEEMRGRFEQRIEVTKDAVRGSYARVV